MTAETSNAQQQGHPVAFTIDNGPGRVVGLEWNPFFPVLELRGRIPLYAAPPPAAARGDVRGTRRPSDAAIAAAFWEHRARENSIPSELCDVNLVQFGNSIVSRARVLQAALAAEGVQAGEVSAYDLAVLDDAAETLDRLGDGSAGLRAARARIASALSQQPEARGVVDDRVESILHKLNEWSRAYPEDIFREPSKEEREWLHTTKPGLMDRVSASMGRHMVRLIRDDLAVLTATLTGERNGS